MSTAFEALLLAPGPHPDLGSHGETYGRFIGSWTGTYSDRDPDGTVRTGEMEVHFAWVLQGRAVQDLWIARDRGTYGTTLRVFDSASESWRVVWLNPGRNVRCDLIGRRIADDVVQLGQYGDAPIKWIFTDVERDSFMWRGYSLDRDGVTWTLETEFKLRRDQSKSSA